MRLMMAGYGKRWGGDRPAQGVALYLRPPQGMSQGQMNLSYQMAFFPFAPYVLAEAAAVGALPSGAAAAEAVPYLGVMIYR